MSKLRKVVINTYSKIGRLKEGPARSRSLDVEYSTGARKFFIRQPEEMKDFKPEDVDDYINYLAVRGVASGTPAFTGGTEDEVLKKAKKFFELFDGASRSERKVILYDLRCVGKAKLGNQPYFQAEQPMVEISVDYKSAIEESIGESREYYTETTRDWFGEEKVIREDQSDLVKHDDWKVIEYTLRREEFFKFLRSELDKIAAKIVDFMADEEVFLAQVDSGSVRLLNPGER